MFIKIIKEYLKWRKKWDNLCDRCGQCCYARSLSITGDVIVDFNAPCEYFDKETKLCSIFHYRFEICDHCSSVNFFRALFYPWLPSDCAYARTFRLWKKKKDSSKK